VFACNLHNPVVDTIRVVNWW